MHPHAESAAEAAEAAAALGSVLADARHALTSISMPRFERSGALRGDADLDIDRFARELADWSLRGPVREHFMSGVRSGVNGTPTFFINGRPSRRSLGSRIAEYGDRAGDPVGAKSELLNQGP